MDNTKYQFKDIGYWYTFSYPDGFEHKVKMINKAYNEFIQLKKDNPDIVPYQSIDMMELGTVRYTDKKTYQEFIDQKNKYNLHKKKIFIYIFI